MNVQTFKANAATRLNRTGLVLSKHSPEIFMGLGITGVIGATVLACRATLSARYVYGNVDFQIKNLEKSRDEENDMEVVRAQAFVAGAAAVEIIKLYAPAVTVGAISIAALLQSRNILSKRNAGLVAAYKLAEEAYERYRQRVVDEFGDEVDLYLRTNIHDDERELHVMVKDKKGKTTDFTLTREEADLVEYGASQYAKFFDASSPQWRTSNEDNIFFLKAQQTYMNVTLKVQGHVFLNEVYDALGLPRTTAGALVGWVDGHGDSVIDFGIFNPENTYNTDFVNGYQRDEILLDFNVDGLIFEII